MSNLVNLYNIFQLFYYSFQQSIYSFISFQDDNLFFIKIVYIIILGVFTSFTPCFFSLLPIMISYIGVNYIDSNSVKRNIFFMGLISSFITIIFIIYIFDYQAYKLLTNIPIISLLIWILIALNLLQILNISDLFRIIRLIDHFYIDNIFMENYITGLIFGLSSVSCSASIILTTIFWLSSSHSFIQSLIYLFLYILGCILPFAFIFYFPLYISKFNIVVNFWSKLTPVIGVFILIFSIFSLLNISFS